MILDKKELLEKKTIIILEKTKHDKSKYSNLRKKLYEFYQKGSDLLLWEKYIDEIEEMLKENIK